MLEFILISILVFFATTLFGHVTHWSLHQKFTGRLNKSHMTHHLILYPISNYMSNQYRDAGKDNTVRIFALASVPMLSIPILLLLFGKISLFIALWSMVEMIILGLLHDTIHDSFHLHKSIWKKFPGYKRWGKYHYLHHVDMQKNFGIFNFFWDRVFRTIKYK